MTVDQIVEKARTKFGSADLSTFPEKLAVQVNLTGKITGVFYIEVLNGVLSVMPYEYIDRDAAISVTMTNMDKLVGKKLTFAEAVKSGKVTVEGSEDAVLMLDKL